MKTLRRNIGLVDGKDKFFRRTVARNISYSINNSRDVIETYVGMDDIVAVAKEADIHNFIITLPEVNIYQFVCSLQSNKIEFVIRGQFERNPPDCSD